MRHCQISSDIYRAYTIKQHSAPIKAKNEWKSEGECWLYLKIKSFSDEKRKIQILVAETERRWKLLAPWAIAFSVQLKLNH